MSDGLRVAAAFKAWVVVDLLVFMSVQSDRRFKVKGIYETCNWCRTLSGSYGKKKSWTQNIKKGSGRTYPLKMGYRSGGPWGHGWGVPPMFIGAPQLKVNGLGTSRVKMVTMGIERTLSGARYGWGMKKKKKH